MTKILLSPEATAHQYGWPDITPTQHTDPTIYKLNAAALSFWDTADAITDKALDRGYWEQGELEEIAALCSEAETLEAIAKGTIEFVIVPNNPKPEGVNGKFIKTTNDYYDMCVWRGLIKGRE